MSEEDLRAPTPEPKIIVLSKKTEGSYAFDTLVNHEAFNDYKGPIIATDFVVDPTDDVTKEPIVAGNVLVGFKFTGIVNGEERTVHHTLN